MKKTRESFWLMEEHTVPFRFHLDSNVSNIRHNVKVNWSLFKVRQIFPAPMNEGHRGSSLSLTTPAYDVTASVRFQAQSNAVRRPHCGQGGPKYRRPKSCLADEDMD